MNAPITKIEPAPTLNDAIASIMAEIRPLAKGEKNSHGNYNFASIDAFLDLTRPLCAKHRLTIRQQEESIEIVDTVTPKGPAKALMMRFAFMLQCGAESDGPFYRTIMVPASMGSQAFGAAQSYALKQFLRSLFQISTGEKDDIDHHDTGELGQIAVINDTQWAEIVSLIEATNTDAQAFCTAYKIDSLKALPAAAFDRAKRQLNTKLAKMAEKETVDA